MTNYSSSTRPCCLLPPC